MKGVVSGFKEHVGGYFRIHEVVSEFIDIVVKPIPDSAMETLTDALGSGGLEFHICGNPEGIRIDLTSVDGKKLWQAEVVCWKKKKYLNRRSSVEVSEYDRIFERINDGIN